MAKLSMKELIGEFTYLRRRKNFYDTIRGILETKGFRGNADPDLYDGFLVKLIIKRFKRGESSNILLAAYGLLNGFQETKSLTKRREDYAKWSGDTRDADSIRSDEDKCIPKLADYFARIDDLDGFLANARDYIAPDDTGVCPYLEPYCKTKKLKSLGAGNGGPVNNLPFLNTVFIERPEFMERIRAGFQDGNNILTLAGFGGMGKTRLAQEYARTNAGLYNYICWINAESEKAIKESCETFLDKLDNGFVVDDADSTRRTFIYFFEHHKKWLIIYDNADYRSNSQYDFLRKYLPNCADPSQNILVTTRYSLTLDNAAPIEIGVFTPNEAVSCLIKRSGVEDSEGAAMIAERLGNHPLAIVYAAGSIRYSKSYGVYLKRLEEHGVGMFEERNRDIRDYERTVQGTFEIIWDDLKSEANGGDRIARAAMQFVNFGAFMSSEWVVPLIFKYDNLKSGITMPLSAICADNLDRDRLIRRVCGCYLFEAEGERLSIHRLLQEIIRSRLGMRGREYVSALLNIYVNCAGILSRNPNEKSDKESFEVLITGAVIEPNYYELPKYSYFLSAEEIQMMETVYTGFALASVIANQESIYGGDIRVLDRICNSDIWKRGIDRYINHFMDNYSMREDIVAEGHLVFSSCCQIAYNYYSLSPNYVPQFAGYCYAGALAGRLILERMTRDRCYFTDDEVQGIARYCYGTATMSFYAILDMMGRSPKRTCMNFIEDVFEKARMIFDIIKGNGRTDLLAKTEKMGTLIDALKIEYDKIADDSKLSRDVIAAFFNRAISLYEKVPICWTAAKFGFEKNYGLDAASKGRIGLTD